MATASPGTAESARLGQLLLARVAEQGTAAHDYAMGQELVAGPDASRNIADLTHFLCTLHGRYPGVVDHAAGRVTDPGARAWLADAAYAFAGERAYLAKLAVAAGPVPSTPGAADSDSTVRGQRHAIEMLAQSERGGCAVGAAMAVILDWAHIRRALDAAARRFAVEPPGFGIGHAQAIAGVADQYAVSVGTQRALIFGADQILVQHYGLWDLLETRQQARAAS
ncbi:MAG: hypothetical protein JWO25_836 [Alphaproteobacteria bacterium]|nr:hypothetical protein [Alphaproteobacteria bacterium]